MAAKPRVTVRLAPSDLHGLAYIAALRGTTPAELARELIGLRLREELIVSDRVQACQDHYMTWLAEQAARGPRAEQPDQRDYDRLAAGEIAGPLEQAAAAAPGGPPGLPERPLEGYVQHPLSTQQIRSIYARDRRKAGLQ